jgi:hypothetical protein
VGCITALFLCTHIITYRSRGISFCWLIQSLWYGQRTLLHIHSTDNLEGDPCGIFSASMWILAFMMKQSIRTVLLSLLSGLLYTIFIFNTHSLLSAPRPGDFHSFFRNNQSPLVIPRNEVFCHSCEIKERLIARYTVKHRVI